MSKLDGARDEDVETALDKTGDREVHLSDIGDDHIPIAENPTSPIQFGISWFQTGDCGTLRHSVSRCKIGLRTDTSPILRPL